VQEVSLFMILLGCTPAGRNIEQHDIFFGIAADLRNLVPQMEAFWPEGRVHIDAWAKVDHVDGHDVTVVAEQFDPPPHGQSDRLFFVNLGGYQPGTFEELHEKRLVITPSVAAAVARCRRSAFYRDGQGPAVDSHARSHVDDKHLASDLVVDDVVDVARQVAPPYELLLTPAAPGRELALNIGYLPLHRV